MKETCELLPASYAWFIVAAAWVTAGVLSIWHSRHRRDAPLFENHPYGTDVTSPIAWIAYLFAWTSQLSPVGALSRLLPALVSRLVLDLYILSWSVLAITALYTPGQIALFVPLFAWRLWEYVAIIIYQRVFRAGFPRRMETDASEYRLRYRPLFVDVVNYITFALISASIYWANHTYFGPNALTSPADALYFSIVTMTTIGYGDFTPRACLRWVAVTQVSLGIFIIVIVIATLIGAGRPLFPNPRNSPGRPDEEQN